MATQAAAGRAAAQLPLQWSPLPKPEGYIWHRYPQEFFFSSSITPEVAREHFNVEIDCPMYIHAVTDQATPEQLTVMLKGFAAARKTQQEWTEAHTAQNNAAREYCQVAEHRTEGDEELFNQHKRAWDAAKATLNRAYAADHFTSFQMRVLRSEYGLWNGNVSISYLNEEIAATLKPDERAAYFTDFHKVFMSESEVVAIMKSDISPQERDILLANPVVRYYKKISERLEKPKAPEASDDVKSAKA